MKRCICTIVLLSALLSLAACAAQPAKDRALVQEERAESFWNRLGEPADAR